MILIVWVTFILCGLALLWLIRSVRMARFPTTIAAITATLLLIDGVLGLLLTLGYHL